MLNLAQKITLTMIHSSVLRFSLPCHLLVTAYNCLNFLYFWKF